MLGNSFRMQPLSPHLADDAADLVSLEEPTTALVRTPAHTDHSPTPSAVESVLSPIAATSPDTAVAQGTAMLVEEHILAGAHITAVALLAAAVFRDKKQSATKTFPFTTTRTVDIRHLRGSDACQCDVLRWIGVKLARLCLVLASSPSACAQPATTRPGRFWNKRGTRMEEKWQSSNYT